ncbi:hypothetical protein BCR43DRAFT_488721 [Syncephalastrum racemosum]|uniref:Uncharacterized protein n=1 Tax=Syncephalastrum racemosum TaxID=13706 RepID=A0A1X2HKI0_SYNRA|nr:hypothetical protein BCR43DRAFT_488721 [Syncephalastrum racemosum]
MNAEATLPFFFLLSIVSLSGMAPGSSATKQEGRMGLTISCVSKAWYGAVQFYTAMINLPRTDGLVNAMRCTARSDHPCPVALLLLYSEQRHVGNKHVCLILMCLRVIFTPLDFGKYDHLQKPTSFTY